MSLLGASPGQTVPVPVVPGRLHLQAIPGDTHAHAHRRAAVSVRHLPEALHAEIQSQHTQADALRYVGGAGTARRGRGGSADGGALTVQGRPFQCLQCPAAFTCKQYLEIHNRTHTGERPYQCDVCLKRFAQKSTLNIHKRTHTGKSRRVCERFISLFLSTTFIFTCSPAGCYFVNLSVPSCRCRMLGCRSVANGCVAECTLRTLNRD